MIAGKDVVILPYRFLPANRGRRLQNVARMSNTETSDWPTALAELQREQFRHDQRNHSDIAYLPKPDRLKHYGLHFAKYAGRLARGADEPKSVERTVADAALVCLSAANTLHQRLDEIPDVGRTLRRVQLDPLRPLCDAAGRFADACEKIDHMEEFLPIASHANEDIARWVVEMSTELGFNLPDAVRRRRDELSLRFFNFRELE